MVFATLFSKVLGLFRSTLTASIFGAGMEGVAFSAASKIPFALFDMLFSTAILGAFVPIYCGHLLSDQKRAKAFSSSFFTFTGCVTAVTACLGMIFAKPIISLAAPNLDEKTWLLATHLLRIIFPAILFAGLAYTLIGILQSNEAFLLPAMISAVSNAFILIYLLICQNWDHKRTAVLGLAAIYLVSWLIQFFTLSIPLIKKHKMPYISLKFHDPDLISAEKRAIPVMFGAWLIPIVTLTANAFSSYIDMKIENGEFVQGAAIVVFENGFSVYSIAGGLVTYGICNYLFPKLSAKFSKGDADGFSSSARMGFSFSLMITIPLAAAIFFTSDEIIRFLFLRGNFTEELAHYAALSLKMLSFSLPAYSMVEFLSRTAYSGGKVKIPFIGALLGIVFHIGLSLILLWIDMLSVATVALSVSLGISVCAITDLILSRTMLCLHFGIGQIKKILIFLCGTVISVFTMYISHEFLKKIMPKSSVLENLFIIAIVFAVGFVVYLIWMFLYRKFLFFENQPERRISSDG